MNLHDALFNWLQMRIVADARPEDNAARDTLDFFAALLRDDHRLSRVDIAARDESLITVEFESESGMDTKRFDREMAEKLLADINENPKYNQ